MTVVLDHIAASMGVSFTMDRTPMTIDLNFKDVTLENVMSYFRGRCVAPMERIQRLQHRAAIGRICK